MINPNLSLYFDRNVISYPDPKEDNPYNRKEVLIDEIHLVPHEYLLIPEDQARRLFLQYLNLRKIPTELTKDIYEELRAEPAWGRDHIAFKTIVSVYDALYFHLTQPSTRYSITSKTQSFFNKHLKYYPSSLQTAIRQFFKNQSDYLSGIQNMTNVNPATYKTLSNKLILEKYGQGATGIIRPTDYNESLSLLVDPSMTPDSQNVNRVNEMNKTVDYDGFTTYIHVFDLKDQIFTKLELLVYLTTPIVSSLDVDWKNKKLRTLDGPRDKYTIRYRGQNDTKIYFDDLKNYELRYADTPADDRLSISTRMIPNINFSDSVRISMGARMINQSIEIAKPEEPIVGTGHKDFKDSSLFIKSPVNGTVKEIKDNEVLIEYVNDKGNTDISHIKIPENLGAQYSINVSFKVMVKPGDKVNANDTIIKPLGINEDGAPMLGTNAFIAFANYKGYTYEDGAVISESFARKLTHTYILDVEQFIYDFDTLDGIIPIGSQVASKDELLSITRKKSPSAQVRGIIDIFAPENNDLVMDYPSPCLVPNNVTEAYVVDVNYMTGGATNAKAQRLLDDYRNGLKRVELPFDYHYNQLEKETGDATEKWALKVTVRLVVRSKASVGDKISNRYGSKGVITLVLPDNEMWRTKDGRVLDCILNPFAVISRKNVPQTMEAGMTLLAERVWNKWIKDNLNNPKLVRDHLKHYRFDSYLELSDAELIAKLSKDQKLYYITGCYGTITPAEVAKLLKEAGLGDGRIDLYKANGQKLRQPVVCGYQYMIKLMFLVSHMNKVTSDSIGMDESMVLGMGSEKDSGQSIEEMIFWGLQSHGALKAIDEFRSNAGRNSEFWLRAHCLAAGIDLSIQAEPNPDED
jgi:DNA-directed RNA polymerase beta subunit